MKAVAYSFMSLTHGTPVMAQSEHEYEYFSYLLNNQVLLNQVLLQSKMGVKLKHSSAPFKPYLLTLNTFTTTVCINENVDC